LFAINLVVKRETKNRFYFVISSDWSNILYLIPSALVAFIITTSHAPLDLKIIGELLWFAGYIVFDVAYYSTYKTIRNLLCFRIDLSLR